MNIIITGASKGLGKALALRFAAAENTLFLGARNEQSLQATASEIKILYPHCTIHIYSVDVTKLEQLQAFANFCLQIATPDILINNAGKFLPGAIYQEPEGLLKEMIETNLYSAYHLTRMVLPNMLQQIKITNTHKHIFNICSIASLQPYANGGSYSISKFALLGFSKNLREELKPHLIKVTAVMPGATYTDSWIGSGVQEDRIMQANDVAAMVYAAAQLSPQACVEDIVMRPQLGDL